MQAKTQPITKRSATWRVACLLLLAAAGCSSKPADDQPAPAAPSASGGAPGNANGSVRKPMNANAPPPAPLPGNTVAAWTKAGAKSGWMRTTKIFTFAPRFIPSQMQDAVPAFKIEGKDADKMLEGLPAPQQPFGISSSFSELSDAGLKKVAGFTQLAMLELSYTSVTDEGLKNLAPLQQLRALQLNGTDLTDSGLKNLAPLSQLTWLSVRCGDEGLKNLAPLKQLTHLYVASTTKLTDEGLKHLAPFTQLTALELETPSITGEGLKHLTPLTRLALLDLRPGLGMSKLTDAGLENLPCLPELTSLNLHSLQIGDEALKHLTCLPKLESLDIDKPK